MMFLRSIIVREDAVLYLDERAEITCIGDVVIHAGFADAHSSSIRNVGGIIAAHLKLVYKLRCAHCISVMDGRLHFPRIVSVESFLCC